MDSRKLFLTVNAFHRKERLPFSTGRASRSISDQMGIDVPEVSGENLVRFGFEPLPAWKSRARRGGHASRWEWLPKVYVFAVLLGWAEGVAPARHAR